jgi:hypothetical protein
VGKDGNLGFDSPRNSAIIVYGLLVRALKVSTKFLLDIHLL